VVPFLLAAYLLRYVPIRIQTGILIGRGLTEDVALSQASYMFLEGPIGASVIGILQGLLWYVLVCILVRSIEKRACNLKVFGFSRNGNSLVLVALGFLFGLIKYFSYFAVGSVFGQSSFRWSSEKSSIFLLVLVSLDMLANGFGEEAAFRAYWQRLIVDRHGLWVGIILASASFVLLHLLIARFTVMALLASIMLAGLYGILYIWTESIFFVASMHTIFNLASRIFGQWPSDISLVIINSFVLIGVIIMYLRIGRRIRN
jgi:uncharacterized protein